MFHDRPAIRIATIGMMIRPRITPAAINLMSCLVGRSARIFDVLDEAVDGILEKDEG